MFLCQLAIVGATLAPTHSDNRVRRSMKVKLTPRKRLNRIFETTKQARANAAGEKASPQEIKKFVRKYLAPAFETAFDRAGLNSDNPADWDRLLIYFALAHYGNKGPGRKKEWKPKKLQRLFDAISSIRRDNASFS